MAKGNRKSKRKSKIFIWGSVVLSVLSIVGLIIGSFADFKSLFFGNKPIYTQDNRPFIKTPGNLGIINGSNSVSLVFYFENSGTTQADEVKISRKPVEAIGFNDDYTSWLRTNQNLLDVVEFYDFGIIPPGIERNLTWVLSSDEFINVKDKVWFFVIDYSYGQQPKFNKKNFSFFRYSEINGNGFFNLIKQFEI